MVSTRERYIQTTPAAFETVNMRFSLRLGAMVGSLAAASVVRGAACPLDSSSAIAISSRSSSPTLAAPLKPSFATPNVSKSEGRRTSNCFPALSFKMPKEYLPKLSDDWWCDEESEYAFMGFSYEVTACECLFVVSHS